VSIYAAILILGASGTATRTVTVEDSIAAIVGRVILGGLQDVSASRNNDRDARRVQGVGELAKAARDLYEHVGQISLRIDGEPRTGWAWGVAAIRVATYAIRGIEQAQAAGTATLRIDGEPHAGWAWGAAACRVAGYCLDRRANGHVEYCYRLRVRDLDVRRSTRIGDGYVVLTTDIYGRIGPRGELYHVRIVLDAKEQNGRTIIVGTATGWTEIGRRCRLVASIASRQIRSAMDRELLGTIQRGGTDWYRAGTIAEILR